MQILKLFIFILGSYIALKLPGLLFSIPIPSSLVLLYLFFITVITVLVMTTSESSAKKLFAPVIAIVTEPSKRRTRNILFAVLPFLAALLTYFAILPDGGGGSINGFRVVHPAPPSAIKAWGRTYDLTALENPLRVFKSSDPKLFKRYVKEGGDIYFSNCFFCHGAKLDGRGQYAHALNPRPLTFQGIDTIAQLQESYVFWRVVKGGPGLPELSAPWSSSMPVWEEKLSEDEVWKVILFIYDYTGNSPREWSK